MAVLALAAYISVLLLTVFVGWRLITSQSATSFAMLFYLGLLTLVRPPLIFLGLDDMQPETEFNSPFGDMAFTFLILAVWVSLFYLANRVSWHSRFGFSPNSFTSLEYNHPEITLKLVMLLLTATGLLITGFLIFQYGSFSRFMFAVKVEKSLSGLFVLRQICVLGAIMSMYCLFRSAISNGVRSIGFYLSFVCLMLNFWSNFAWGNRENIALIVLAGLIGWSFHVARFPKKWSLVIIVTLTVGMVSLHSFRKDVIISQTSNHFGEETVREISRAMHFVQFDAFTLALRDSGVRFDYRYGEDFKNGLLSVVPRSLLPDRESYHTGGWFRREYQPGMINGWPSTVIGDWVLNFGLYGVVVGALLSGFIAGFFDKYFYTMRNIAWSAALSASFGLLLFKGGVGPGFFQQFFLLALPIWIIVILLNITVGGIKFSLHSNG